MKTEEDWFRDWHSEYMGYGYGTGEQHTIPALKLFLGSIPEEGAYDYRELEEAMDPAALWLLIGILCACDVIEYGGSPRFGWLSTRGKWLKGFCDGKSDQELYGIATMDTTCYTPCFSDQCQCPEPCNNPMFKKEFPIGS